MVYLFVFLLLLAIIGLNIHASRKDGHGMAYCFFLITLWGGLTYWFW